LIIFSSAGFVWYGGLIGSLLSAYIVSRYYKIDFLTTADMAGPAPVIGQGQGRIGCHLSGDGDWGMPTMLPWGVNYLNAIVGWNGNTVLKLDGQNDRSPASILASMCIRRLSARRSSIP
jgi:prolipoprotein diacylglyceryltransferase